MSPLVSPADIRAAAERIAGHLAPTPVVLSPSLSARCGLPVHLKLESRQTTGSFKLRGATNAVARLSSAEKGRGVVAASTGNHGRALSFAAKLEGVRAVVCMSSLVPENKLAEIRRLGAEARIVGRSQDDAQEEAERLAREGMVMIPPFDHADVIAGQGTIGLEILAAVPDAETILVPLSGGGLATGVAAALKGARPAAKVIGVSMRRGAAMQASLEAGHPVLVEELPTLADSLGGGIGLDNRLTFRMCSDLLDGVILLSEGEIVAGIRHLYAEEREIAEGAGAVGVAALLAGKVRAKGPVVALVSGRNIDMALHQRIVCGEERDFLSPLEGGEERSGEGRGRAIEMALQATNARSHAEGRSPQAAEGVAGGSARPQGTSSTAAPTPPRSAARIDPPLKGEESAQRPASEVFRCPV